VHAQSEGFTSHGLWDGLHIAALAGAWNGVVTGFGGLRHLSAVLALAPRLPAALTRIAFRLRRRGRCLRVESTPAGPPLPQRTRLTAGTPPPH
jgi:trehalose/maltose hydrolase-like predicted phosphorylase